MSERTCVVDACGKPTGQSGTARGLCGGHYREWRAGQRSLGVVKCRQCAAPMNRGADESRICSDACARAAVEEAGAVKVCRLCRVEKLAATEFQRKASARDGRAATCRLCDSRRRVQARIDSGVRRPDSPPGFKWCSQCDTEKAVAEFYVRRSGPQAGGLHAHCRECVKRKQTERARAKGVKPKREADPLSIKRYRLARDYNLTVEDYFILLLRQSSRCAGCSLAWDESDQWFCVDHDHGCCSGSTSCGHCVRGLLCVGCNFAAGHAGDDPRVLRRLANYIEAGQQGVLAPAG